MIEEGEVILRADDIEKLPDYYQYQASLSKHRIIKTKSGVIRYEKLNYAENLDLNGMWARYQNGELTRDYMMQFYRDIGYSIDGYEDIWGGEMEKMRLNTALTCPIEELLKHWHGIDFVKACENAAWDLTQESTTSIDEAVELLRLAAYKAKAGNP